ncbi:MAG TPA: FAD/NAD(P)-binding protein, partial [Candidatus Eisenbacteria bacterium]|nr:FAD/NAD(P)-binding protein [Candidatus Eisenbacteria bacterium]
MAKHPKSSPATLDVAILGAGFSGAMVATHLLRMARDAKADVRVRLVDPTAIGRGRAYATTSPAHRLNVRAAVMGAFPDDPEHFARWAHARDASMNGDGYLPRGLYGDYVAEIVARERATAGARFESVCDEAIDVEESGDGLRVRLRSGATLTCAHLVLATGHPLPGLPVTLDPELVASGRYRENPWARDVLDGLEPDATLLLLGSGLTTVDVLLESRRREIAGTVHILSRRGLLPQAHAASPVPRPAPPDIGTGNVRSMTRRLRDAIRDATRRGVDWRAVFDSLRPETATLWATLPLQEKRRFLRHVRPYWEVHRHRIAPDIAA